MATFSSSGRCDLDNFIRETVESGAVPGFVLGVSNIEGEIYFQGGGTHVVGDLSSGEINPESVFWICSQTKMITALAALKLIEDGKISLDTPLGDYLPEFRNPVIVDRTSTPKTTFRPAQTVITVKHLLNFSSGLFYPVVRDDLFALPEAYTSKAMYASSNPLQAFYRILIGELPGVPLKFEPGTDFVYGFSSDALGFLIEKVSGQTLEQFCRERIFNPLGMESCSFYLTPALKKRLVSLSVRSDDGSLKPWAGEVEIMEHDPAKVSLHLGGIGMFSSMRDYLKLLRHILQINACKNIANPIFRTETLHQLFIPALTEKGSKSLSDFLMVPGTQWGTALAIATQDNPQGRKKGSIWWGGWAGTEHFIDPVSGIAVVFGTQIVPQANAQTMAVWTKLEALIYAALDQSASTRTSQSNL
ncbi:beta-lactamase/transpeptidase-like protein [Pholiota conissans]|uniref:Beta-lactamase/transpeptidase-like protein n=1 Tax=Pholiota conissans TaxID=109636 RepID=A0A9P6CYU2_9AGAR|nr:beta-lactamase/transpeptidase-like protein [Pholiota conissans]